MLGQPESVSLSRHSLLHKLVLLSPLLLAFRVVMVVLIVIMVLTVLLEPRLSGIFHLNPGFSGQRLFSLVFIPFFCLFLTFLLGFCISSLSTAGYGRFLLFLLLIGVCFGRLLSSGLTACFICLLVLVSFGLAPLFNLQYGIEDGFLFVLGSTYSGFYLLTSVCGSVFTCFISPVLVFFCLG